MVPLDDVQLRFVRPRAVLPTDWPPGDRTVVAPSELDESELAQMIACIGLGSDVSFTVEELFAPGFRERGGDHEWLGESVEVPIEWWDVVDRGGELRFRLWLYQADCAQVFVGNGASIAAHGIQFGATWELVGEWEDAWREAFAAAHRRAMEQHPRTELAQFFPITG